MDNIKIVDQSLNFSVYKSAIQWRFDLGKVNVSHGTFTPLCMLFTLVIRVNLHNCLAIKCDCKSSIIQIAVSTLALMLTV